MTKETFILLVAANTQVGKLAGAIAAEVMKGTPLQIRAIGATAVNQAVKAVIRAREWLTDGDLLIALTKVEDSNTLINETPLVYVAFDLFYVRNKISQHPTGNIRQ